MKKWLLAALMLAFMLVVAGCANPKPIEPLTEQDKAQMVEIALAHPDVSKWLEETDVYSVEEGWVVIAWDGSQAVGWYWMDYEDIKDGSPPSDITYARDEVTINPQIYIRIGEPTEMFISAIFDPDREKILTIQLQPGRKSPGPDKGSP